MAFFLCLILTIAWLAFMTFLSHQDGEHTGRASWELAERLRFLDSDVDKLNRKLRRLAHIAVFAILTIFLGLTLHFGGLPMWILLFSAVWSYVDEATKPWIQGRHFSWHDVGLNLIGTCIGSAVVLILYCLF